MHLRTKRLALSAVMTALAAVFMYFSSIVPTARLAFAAAACMCTAVTVAETGPAYALISCAACAAISLLLAPSTGWLYAGLLGWYPSFKCLAERLRSAPARWAVKICVIAAAVFLLFTLVSGLADVFFPKLAAYTLPYMLLGVAAMVVFDVALSKFISYYIGFIRPKILKQDRG